MVRPFSQEEVDCTISKSKNKVFTAVKIVAIIINPALYVFFTIFYFIYYCA